MISEFRRIYFTNVITELVFSLSYTVKRLLRHIDNNGILGFIHVAYANWKIIYISHILILQFTDPLTGIRSSG